MSGLLEWMSSSLDSLLCRGADEARGEVPPGTLQRRASKEGGAQAVSRVPPRMRWIERARGLPPPPLQTQAPPLDLSCDEEEAERLRQLELEEQQALQDWRLKKQEETRQMELRKAKKQESSPLSSPPLTALSPDSPESAELLFSPEPSAAMPKRDQKTTLIVPPEDHRESPQFAAISPRTPSPPDSPLMARLHIPGSPPSGSRSPDVFRRQGSGDSYTRRSRTSRSSLGNESVSMPSTTLVSNSGYY
ncbi:hypothetical protein AK812_SmicGene27072 [Symbiodinium microadriaticum]|uniref:Uncharacterized protein n=1 Tax=Symbiodinium microadriaticum TaxID=2951 RepID=A0A1Q9D806_SYMMI|nr:hypothetical protein AK812_SmicGene27072 [Symbiodinium microadriaticum]